MNTQERIAKIGEFARNEQMKKVAEISRADAYRLSLVKKIKALAPRLAELKKVADALTMSNIPFNKFITNGLSHQVGFFEPRGFHREPKEKLPCAFGIMGGEWNGEDFEIDFDGNIISNNSRKKIREMEEVLSKFNDFEKKFYEYVDSL